MAEPATEASAEEQVVAYLKRHNDKPLLRFITCGSVDDGKSTLIGRLLYESNVLLEDQLAALEADSKRVGTQGDALDLALLLDGLEAEREQGITIDVAYRYFSTDKRTFIVADTPGHEQYTRNMVTGASTADCAVVLVDARNGLLTQSRRHMMIVSLLGVRHVVIAINKMDVVARDQARFTEIESAAATFALELGLPGITCIPTVALTGGNVVQRDELMPWYQGPTLLEYLESVDIDDTARQGAPLRLPVQWVVRRDSTFRGFAGTISSGTLRPGETVAVLPSGRRSTVERIVTSDGDLEVAVAGQAVVVTLADEVDVSRGEIIAQSDAVPEVGDQFEATLVWMAEQPLLPGRGYIMRTGTAAATAIVNPLKHKLDPVTLAHVAATKLELNEIGECHIGLDRRIAFDPYLSNRDTGGFILIDRMTLETVAAGMLRYALRRSANLHWQHVDVDKVRRAAIKGQRPAVIWLTGLSGSGKSTIANLVDQRLHTLGLHTYMLDGDNVRMGLCRDLGFTAADRVENLRRVGEVAKLMVDAGLIVLASFISPYRNERASVRALLEPGEFLEVFVDTPLAVAEQRDPKGLYAKARRGELRNFTGVDAPYELPEAPELQIDTTILTAEQAASAVLEMLAQAGILGT